jgi:hypothetical protein
MLSLESDIEFSGVSVLTDFLGASAKLRKTTIAFFMSVRPSVFVEQLCSHWMDFDEI